MKPLQGPGYKTVAWLIAVIAMSLIVYVLMR